MMLCTRKQVCTYYMYASNKWYVPNNRSLCMVRHRSAKSKDACQIYSMAYTVLNPRGAGRWWGAVSAATAMLFVLYIPRVGVHMHRYLSTRVLTLQDDKLHSCRCVYVHGPRPRQRYNNEGTEVQTLGAVQFMLYAWNMQLVTLWVNVE